MEMYYQYLLPRKYEGTPAPTSWGQAGERDVGEGWWGGNGKEIEQIHVGIMIETHLCT
jgi:hypothetical protein